MPEDRQSQGLIQTLDICKNTSIASLGKYVKGIFLNNKAEEAAVDAEIKDIHIKVADKKTSDSFPLRRKSARRW